MSGKYTVGDMVVMNRTIYMIAHAYKQDVFGGFSYRLAHPKTQEAIYAEQSKIISIFDRLDQIITQLENA